jgi:2-dehydro-3-deoxygluconokinase
VFDAVSLGEVMLRLDPGDRRIRTARQFDVWEGGGEYNVVRGLQRCFGQRTAVVTALADNEVGRLIEGLILAGGVDTTWISWVDPDSDGRGTRNGLNFTERGFGVRGAVGVSDRGYTAASAMTPDSVDWEYLFGVMGVRWFHTGGIFAGLSESAPSVVEAAMAAAARHGTVVSYDTNYRPSLWSSTGGMARARQVNASVAHHVDVMIGNVNDVVEGSGGLDALAEQFPNIAVAATTLRTVVSASVNDWGARAWSRESGIVDATFRPGLHIFDRIGGGDGFVSGLVFGLLNEMDLHTALEYGAAHGALAMTTPGDTSMATAAEVVALAAGGSARVQR